MSFIIEGKEFKTQREIAEHYGIDYLTFKTRIQRWGDIEKAALTPITKVGKAKEEVTVNGVRFGSIAEASRFYDVKLSSVHYKRREFNCSVEEAINRLLIDNGIVINGMSFTTIGEVCNRFKISRSTITKVMSKGYSVEEAVMIILKRREEEEKKNIFKFNGKIYKSIDEICKDFRLNKSDIALEMSKGKNLGEALKDLLGK